MTTGTIAIDLLLFALAGLLTVALLQRRLIYAAPKAVRYITPGPFAGLYDRRYHTLHLPDGNRLEGFSAHPRYTPPGAPVRVLIYFGGRSENVAWTPDIASNLPDWHIYAFNHRGFGYSTGIPSEQALKADADCVHAHVMGLHQDRLDVVAVVGRSLGTVLATWLAARNRVDRLVLLSPFTSLTAVLMRVPVLRWLRRLLVDQLDSSATAPSVLAPTLVIASQDDSRIPACLSFEIAQMLSGTAQVELVNGLSHAALPRSSEAQIAISRFLHPVREPASPAT